MTADMLLTQLLLLLLPVLVAAALGLPAAAHNRLQGCQVTVMCAHAYQRQSNCMPCLPCPVVQPAPTSQPTLNCSRISSPSLPASTFNTCLQSVRRPSQ